MKIHLTGPDGSALINQHLSLRIVRGNLRELLDVKTNSQGDISLDSDRYHTAWAHTSPYAKLAEKVLLKEDLTLAILEIKPKPVHDFSRPTVGGLTLKAPKRKPDAQTVATEDSPPAFPSHKSMRWADDLDASAQGAAEMLLTLKDNHPRQPS